MNEALGDLSATEKRALLARLLKARAAAEMSVDTTEFPLSAGQQGLWYAYQRDPEITAYNVCLPSRFRSEIDLDSLRRAVDILVQRHSALRTLFDESQETHQPVQRVQSVLNAEFRVVEISDADEALIAERAAEEIARPFDLKRGPLLRLAAFRIAPDDVVVIATTHHIVVDFWSLVLIMDEIRELYAAAVQNREPDLHPAPANYQRFVRAQADFVASERGTSIAADWKRRLAGTPQLLDWPTDYQRPRKFTHRAAALPLQFPTGIGARLATFAKQNAVTANVVTMAILQVLIGRFAGQDAFSIGTPFSGRSQREYEKTVGFFVNLLPITADLSTNPSLRELIIDVARKMVDALANEALPFSEIVRQCAVGRDTRHHPLFQVSCTFERSQLASERGRAAFVLGDDRISVDFVGLRQQAYPVKLNTCHYDMEFIFEFHDDELRGMICYCSDLFAPETVQELNRQFIELSVRLLDQPDTPVKCVPWAEPTATDPPAHDRPRESIGDMLVDSDHEMIVLARRFSAYLCRIGIKPGAMIPVHMLRGPRAWVALLGVMFCRATPIPIDADQPAVGADVLRSDALIDYVVSDQEDGWTKQLGATRITIDQIAESDQPHPMQVLPDDRAYVIYTSGSTGTPKGVIISHAAIANAMRWQRSATPFSSADRVLVLMSHQFDATMAVVITTLDQHANLFWPDDPHRLDLDQLIDQIIRDQITILPAVTSFIRVLASHPRFAECTSIRQIWTGAEVMPVELPALLRSKIQCELWNFYGPTEAAVQVTSHCIDEGDSMDRRIPIGREIDGVQVHVVDPSLAPVPAGVPGQILISGRGLAEGYLNRPELTEQAFVASKFLRDALGNPLRVYLSGDLGRRRGDGAIEFLGRMDHQIKLRGYRIELEEIERTLERFPSVRHAAAKVVHAGTTGERLAAYVSGLNRSQLAGLSRHLADQLPPYKRPASIELMDELPLGASGKVDRKRLPDPADLSGDGVMIRPRSPLETFLEQRFAQALELDSVSIETNFFEAGGTSLQAAILASQLADELGFAISTSLLFDLGDLRSIAARLVSLHQVELRNRFGDASIEIAHADASTESNDSLLVAIKPTGTRPAMFMVHPPGGIVVCYRELAARLPENQPLIAIRSRGLHGDESLPSALDEMATDYVRAIKLHQPRGPYLVGGWSLGGVIAIEMARQLLVDGNELLGVVLLDSSVPERNDADGFAAGQEYGLDLSLAELGELSAEDQLPFLYKHAEQLGVLDQDAPREIVEKALGDMRRLFALHVELCQSYTMQPVDVPVLLIRPREVPGQADDRPDRGWGRWTGAVTTQTVSGHHHSMVQSPGASEIATAISQYVESQFTAAR